MYTFFQTEKYARFTKETPYVFAGHSSIGVGGIAAAAFSPTTEEETVALITALEQDGVPFHVLGNLTNVLPADGVSKRVVVSMKKLRGVQKNGNLLSVRAGTTAGALLAECKRLRLSGAEFLTGIPCTVGGALYMNAGVGGAYIGEIVESVTALYDGQIITLTQADCGYAYKHSVFMQGGFVILRGNLRLSNEKIEIIQDRIRDFDERRKHLPKGKSMGCVFKNPKNAVAGRLIENAGLKGMRVGGAVVSKEHANFIINDNHATARDIKKLIALVKNAVFAQYKINLEEEIRYLD